MPRTTYVLSPVAHVVGPGKLKVINGRLAFATGEGAPLRLDAASLRTVLCYGPVGVSDEAFLLLFKHDVQVAWLSAHGHRCLGRVARVDASTTALRVLQHRALSDPAVRLETARQWVGRKIDSQIAAARHYQRQGQAGATPALAPLHEARGRCASARDLNQLRGVEGSASAAWFSVLGNLLRSPWHFARRTRRPPADPVNALLSLGYTLLLTRAVARCEALGLEAALGALHDLRPGRPSLGCDLVEPLRVPAVDRWVVATCNGGQIAPADFRPEAGGVLLQPAALPRVLQSWERHWSDGHERALDESIAWLTAALRRHDPSPPMPPTPSGQVGSAGRSGGFGSGDGTWD